MIALLAYARLQTRYLAILVVIYLPLGNALAGNEQNTRETNAYRDQTEELDINELIQFLDGELLQQYDLLARLSDNKPCELNLSADQGEALVEPAFFQAQPPLTPSPASPASPSQSNQSRSISASLFGTFGVPRSTLAESSGVVPASATIVSGLESQIRLTTDTGNLLQKSPSVLQIGVQRRNPVIADPRIRGSRVGSMAASGSYWVPARIDLDTVTSKIDSRIVDHIEVIPGPYSALYGPGFEFLDIQLLRAPRYENGFETHGSTAVDFKTNGENWHGRQSVQGGNSNWGFLSSYGHSTGNDYDAGNGAAIPASFKSRDAYFALGGDFTENESLEFSYVRLDQTDLELPGQAFDIDYLVTDGYELQYISRDRANYDEFLLESWYNRTRFEGSAQRSGKRAQFPYYDFIDFVGTTDVDSMSTGYRAAFSWDGDAGERLTAGADLRYVKQELNEFTSGRIGFSPWTDANSPIPRSHSSNPGMFGQWTTPINDQVTLTAGGRVDWVSTNIDDDPAKLAALGIAQPQSSASEILGSDVFSQNDLLGSAFLAIDQELNEQWTAGASVGYAERAPNLTERYAVEPFMFLLQNGLNTVTGDPELDKERVIQGDLRLQHRTEKSRSRITGYYGWYSDYITFENLGIVTGPPLGQVEQVNLKYVNTSRAVLAGVEARSEYDLNRWLIPFATLKYTYGQDRTRNGGFATRQAAPGLPSVQIPGAIRGATSLVPGGKEEPLPSILPLESRLGIQINEPVKDPQWGIEISARVVDNQRRVAASLLETPTPGFTTWDLRTYWRPYDDLQLVAGVENFTDKNFREHIDFRSTSGISVFQPGINFYFGTQLTY